MPKVAVIDADPALRSLLDEWLSAEGCELLADDAAGADLVVVDLPAPRQGAKEVLQRIVRERPDTPHLVLCSSFLPGVDACGPVASSLGVAGVLPKPVSREALTAAVRRLLSQ